VPLSNPEALMKRRPTPRDTNVSIDVDRVLERRELAVHVLIAGDQFHWIPVSLLKPGSLVDDVGEEGRLVLPAWFVQKESIPCR
jgi:hypothetical protein